MTRSKAASPGSKSSIIGAENADPNGNSSGRSYVVFGSTSGFPNPFELGSLDGWNGFVINGEAERDYAGRSVSAGGDLNGDGIDDVIIGAVGANPNGLDNAGRSYVIFGRDVIFLNGFEGNDDA